MCVWLSCELSQRNTGMCDAPFQEDGSKNSFWTVWAMQVLQAAHATDYVLFYRVARFSVYPPR